MRRLLVPACLLLCVLAGLLGAANPKPAPVDFAREVLPILSENCFQCHGPDSKARKASLRLDTREDALRKADPVIIPGKSGDSEVIKRITHEDAEAIMPPPRTKKTLTPAQVETLKRWIDQGATWGVHWAFAAPRRPVPPTVKNTAWVRNPIDAFILARLEKEGLSPSAEAEPHTLLRRLSLDLTGLPPLDGAPESIERTVDRLLASPRYGERMVWEWLEAGRYADSNGYQGDGERTMWPWRDWAVDAFNRNLPYDQFTTWQLAGDLLPGATREQKLATAFLRNHPINGEGGRIADENRVDYVMDMTETVGTVWLGLTFNCCRCHDHKFDAIAQRDYYGLFAYFNQTPVNGGGGDPQTKPVLEMMRPEDEATLASLRTKIETAAKELADEEAANPRKPEDDAKLPKDVLDALKVPAANRNKAQLATIEKHYRPTQAKLADRAKALADLLGQRDGITRQVVRVMVMEDMPKPRETFILTRGQYNKPAAKVEAGTPAVLPPMPADLPRNRLGLARWLTSPEHPLMARVTVNRLWQQFFGVGLVKTVEDFGVQGERPVHPELLDWLAVEFIESGWDVKHLVRLIVTSATYRQSSRVTPALVERDPDNRLLARGPRHRLPSWMIRDQALAASGLLVGTVGGAPVRPYQPAGIWEEATFGTKRYQQDHGDALYRRSVYTFWRRIVGPTLFFDTAGRSVCTVKQGRTNTPLNALATFNDITYIEAARVLAERVLTSPAADDAARLDDLYRRVLARVPTAEERPILLRALTRLRQQFATDPEAAKKLLAVGESKRNDKLDTKEAAAWAALCSLVLNLDETLTKE
jgi:hypothetical protein